MLGNYFDNFFKSRVESERYKMASEVVRSELRLLEEEENKIIVLKSAIHEGIECGITDNFDSKSPLEKLKEKKEKPKCLQITRPDC